MSCYEHQCVECGHSWFDNQRAYGCPKCGHHRVCNQMDELFDEPDADRPDDTEAGYGDGEDEQC